MHNLRKHRKKFLIAGTLVMLTATPSFALFGLGDIVFDPTSYASLVSQATTALNQLRTIQANVTHFSYKNVWRTQLNQLEHANVRNLFGETNGMSAALNTNSPAAASMAWTNASVPMDSATTTYLAGQPQGSAQRSQLAMIEASDSTSPDCLNAIGAYRANRDANDSAGSSLQNDQLDTGTGTNSEVEQLNLLNASEAQHLTELKAQGVLHTCLASQMAVANMQQRNAAVQDLNTWAFVKQQQQNNPTFAGNSSGTWTTYIP